MGLKGAEMVVLGYNTPSDNVYAPHEPPYLRVFHHMLSLQAAAYQNGIWVVATAKAGKEDGFWLHGGSVIVAPTGEIVAKGTTEEDEVISYDCDLALGEYIRNTTFNFAKHRRPEHYKLISERTGVEDRHGELRIIAMQYAVNRCERLTSATRSSTAFVLPRPIAWVTTLGPSGVVNAAPFSFFNVFAEDPPLIMFAINKRPDGRLKDTWLNIERTGEFVVNLTDEPLARAMHDSSGDFPPNVGEPDYLGLKLAPSVDIKPPRLADAPWSMECRTWQVINVKDDRQLVIGEGLRFHIRDELWDPKAMRVHMDRYHPVGRMFADRYCRTDDRMEFPAAPVVKAKAAE